LFDIANPFCATVPSRLQRYTHTLRSAPVSHISAFLILHELTAIAPIGGLAYLFHQMDWLPPGLSESQWALAGTEKFERYFRKKGWAGFGEEEEEGEQKGLSERRLWGMKVLIE
jgi:Hypothetical protein FLILHELTA